MRSQFVFFLIFNFSDREIRGINIFISTLRQTLFSVYVRGNNKTLKAEFETLEKVKKNLDEGKHIRFLEWNDNEMDILNKYLFLTSKPMIYLLNMSKKDYMKKKSKWLLPIKKKVYRI